MKKLYELIQKNSLLATLSDLLSKSRPPARAELPIITLSREKGSGGRPIAYLVEKQLGEPWKVYHKEIIEVIAKETKLEKKLIKEIDESNIPLIEEIVAEFFGRRYFNFSTYYRNLVKILSTIGHRGYAIIVGRGANFLIPASLKVRIICEMPQRIKWMMEYEHLTKTQAVKSIEESDRRRIEFIETIYKHDPRKAHHYDLVIRTGPKLSIDDAATLIVTAAKRRFRI